MTTEEWATLMPAPIDETNVCSDVLLDGVFDNNMYACDVNNAVGFILSRPSIAEYYSNIMEFHPFSIYIDMDPDHFKLWSASIMSRITDEDIPSCDGSVFTFLDDSDGDAGLVYRFMVRGGNYLHVSVKHNVRIPSLID